MNPQINAKEGLNNEATLEFDTWTESSGHQAVRIAVSGVFPTEMLQPAMSATRESFIKDSDEMSPAATTFRVVGD